MAKKVDPIIADVLQKFSMDARDALWDCHGTWCIYHRALERIGAQAGVKFAPPLLMENNGAARSVAICVTGSLPEGQTEWSIGEASPANCKNAYPYAMAEKRGKDRVILKLIGLHGLVYSEEEMDEKAPPSNAALDNTAIATDLIRELRTQKNAAALKKWGESNADTIAKLDEANRKRVRGDYTQQLTALKNAENLAA